MFFLILNRYISSKWNELQRYSTHIVKHGRATERKRNRVERKTSVQRQSTCYWRAPTWYFRSCGPWQKKVTKVSKRRKISPEDERTLQILAEKFRTDENGASCQVHHCKSKHLKSTKPSNLKRHIEQVHPEEYSNLFPHEVNVKKQTELEVYNTLQDAIELVTVNGYSFSMLDASGMHGFTQARLKPLRLQGESLTINRLDIVKKVAEMSEIIRNRI